MSDRTATKPPERCPICNVKHDGPIEESSFGVSYCPHCGVPNFFSPDQQPESVKCVRCRWTFNAQRGGGNIVEFFTKFETIRQKNPTGLLRVTLRRLK